jgi:hypothetical protein
MILLIFNGLYDKFELNYFILFYFILIKKYSTDGCTLVVMIRMATTIICDHYNH